MRAGARHLVLLGPPGAGKSTVGRRVAKALKRRFVDLDVAIEQREGRSVAEIFAGAGEPAFRALERTLTAELLAPGTPPIVLAPGGGWIEDPANRTLLAASAEGVYLKVSPEVAVARMGARVAARPLLAGADPAARVTDLLARREQFYLQANHTVSVDSLGLEEVAAYIVALASIERAD